MRTTMRTAATGRGGGVRRVAMSSQTPEAPVAVPRRATAPRSERARRAGRLPASCCRRRSPSSSSPSAPSPRSARGPCAWRRSRSPPSCSSALAARGDQRPPNAGRPAPGARRPPAARRRAQPPAPRRPAVHRRGDDPGRGRRWPDRLPDPALRLLQRQLGGLPRRDAGRLRAVARGRGRHDHRRRSSPDCSARRSVAGCMP